MSFQHNGFGGPKLTSVEQNFSPDDLIGFLEIFPSHINNLLKKADNIYDLIEVVMDLGRRPQARFHNSEIYLGDREITTKDLQYVVDSIGEFGDDNRAGIEKTLHRISVIRNRQGTPIGLTCRVGRAVYGSVSLITDLIMSEKSVLILGRPGVGKTTILRETARMLAGDGNKRVVIVDTSNEIAGDGDIPHPAIGKSRRLQVENTGLQHKVMIEAVENHMPEVVVIDEMSTDKEALAARTIAERGVQLVATAHGNTLDNLISNPTLSDLVGGTQTVTLGDLEAKRRRTQKTVLEREHDPTFDIVVEIRERNTVAIHKDVATHVDRILRSITVQLEIRKLNSDGSITSSMEKIVAPKNKLDINKFSSPPRINGQNYLATHPISKNKTQTPAHVKEKILFLFGIPKSTLLESAEHLASNIRITENSNEAEIFVTTKQHYNRRPSTIRQAEKSGIPVHIIRRASREQINHFLRRFSTINTGLNQQTTNGSANLKQPNLGSWDNNGNMEELSAMQEAVTAISRLNSKSKMIKLSPQPTYIRRMQHGLATDNNIGSSSSGKDPHRKVIYRKNK
ncbi:MAG: AAA family ATPase [Dehalococcoidia bacterium]|nr:AAA family ATPase [Dehalococcoidia bacterium]